MYCNSKINRLTPYRIPLKFQWYSYLSCGKFQHTIDVFIKYMDQNVVVLHKYLLSNAIYIHFNHAFNIDLSTLREMWGSIQRNLIYSAFDLFHFPDRWSCSILVLFVDKRSLPAIRSGKECHYCKIAITLYENDVCLYE